MLNKKILEKKEIEIELLLVTLQRFNGHNFSGYSEATLLRRLNKILEIENLANISSLIPQVIHNEKFRQYVTEQLTVNVTSLFRDEEVFIELKNKVLPYLASFPRLSVWVAGCAGGEEAYSIAILLAEAGLLSRSHIYATDINKNSLAYAKTGKLYKTTRSWKENQYTKIISDAKLQNHFTLKNKTYTLKPEILSKISFEHHDIVQQPSFITAQLVMCRNVMIYFNKEFQHQAFSKMDAALEKNGFIVIGTSETINNYNEKKRLSAVNQNLGIYQKIKH